MNQTNSIDNLVMFGLTRQEATIYICLVQKEELTGYEVAKLTGISRSNVYSALAGLTEKGAAYLLEGAANKYIAVPIKEFCDNKIRNMEKTAQELFHDIPKMSEVTDGYITIAGYRNIVDKIHTMLLQTKKRLYVSATSDFIQKMEQDLLQVCKAGIKVVIVTDNALSIEGTTIYQSDKKGNQIHLITDSSYVLTGEITGGNTDTCLYSGQGNFVNVFKDALRNEIKLIELTKGENRNE